MTDATRRAVQIIQAWPTGSNLERAIASEHQAWRRFRRAISRWDLERQLEALLEWGLDSQNDTQSRIFRIQVRWHLREMIRAHKVEEVT